MLTLSLPFGALPPTHYKYHGPYRPFGENQLSPSSIGILPLTVSHPMSLQRQRVRASPRFSSGFTLLAVSSPGFGSVTHIYSPFKTRFPYAFGPYDPKTFDVYGNSPVHSSIGTRSPCKHGSLGLSAESFRFYFTGRFALLFAFPSRY